MLSKYRLSIGLTLLVLFIYAGLFGTDAFAVEPWEGNNIGLPMRVLKPWTSLQCGTRSVSSWGRTYQWDNSSVLPSSIVSGGNELLAGPITVYATIGGVSYALPLNNFTFTHQANERVEITAQSVASSVAVNATITIDFDGFMWCILQFSEPSGLVQITALRVDVPMQRVQAKYRQDNTSTGFGLIPDNANVNLGWLTGTNGEYRNFYHWFGNEERGLGFAYSTLQYWKPTIVTNFCTFLSRPTTATYRMNLLQSPALANGLVYKFGIQATPIKPLPADYHSMLGDFAVYGSSVSQLGDYVDMIPIAPQAENSGIGCNIFPGLNDPENWTSCLVNPVSVAHSKGQAVGVAMCPQKLSSTIPNLGTYLSEWRCVPEQSLLWDEIENYDNCPAADSMVDYFVYYWKQQIQQYNIDVLYFDGWLGAWPCKNVLHDGCGYVDEYGQRQETVPLLEARTAMMRVATMLEDTVSSNYIPVPSAPSRSEFPSYHFMIHSWTTVPPIMGFGTSWLTGEYLWNDVVGNPDASYAQLLGFDKLRARSISNNWGVPNFWDAVLADTSDGHLTKMLFAWMLPHGNPIFYLSMMNASLTLDVYNVMKSFETRKAIFTPAWRTNNSIEVVTPVSQDILVATWEANGQVLSVISNVNGVNSANITLKWVKSYIPKLVDALTGQAIPFDANTKTFQLSIGKEDFKLIKSDMVFDFDNDGDVDIEDLSVFLSCWLSDGPSDYTDDDIVDFKDFAYFALAWTGDKSAPYEGLTFIARYNNGLDADYAAGNATATVAHGSGPDVGLSAAGTGAFTSSTPNTALTQTVGYTHSSVVNTGESVRYQAQGNMSLQAGTFVAWTKAAPFNTERMFTPAEGMIFAENGHWSSGNSMTMYDQYYYSYKRDYLLQGSDAYGNMFYVNAIPTAETFDNWVFVAGSWNLSESGQLDLKIWVRPVGQASFSTGTNSYSDITFVDLDGNAPLNIGSDYWGSRIYGGLVDDAQIYDHVLSDDTIESIYSSGIER